MINYKQVQKVYQKVKSDIYYSNNIFYKKMIVEFESSSDKGQFRLNVLNMLQKFIMEQLK